MDDANTNKQFRIYNKYGKYIRLSVDETIAQGHNQWKGWQCSAGVRGLYIDYDGNVWVCNTASSKLDRFNSAGWTDEINKWKKENNNYAELVPQETLSYIGSYYGKLAHAFEKTLLVEEEVKKKYPGFLGNISNYELPSEWFSCPWQQCGCGADVILAKAKTEKHRNILVVSNDGWEGKEKTAGNLIDQIGDQVAVEMTFPIPYQILWDLGRRCNYDCSYCWNSVHNRTSEHKDYDTIIKASSKLIDVWAKGEPIRWNFGGGEPTLHPRFIDLLTYLKSRNQWTMVTSNGTRDHKYWNQAVQQLNSINLSAHFEGLTTEKEEDRFVRNIEEICKHFDEHDDDHWLEIKIMAPPQFIDRAVSLRDKIKNLGTLDKVGANNRIKGFLSLVPIRSLGDSGQLVTYTEEQLALLKNQ